MANTRWLRPGKTWIDENGVEQHELSGIEKFTVDAQKLLAAAPDAYIIVRIGLHPPVSWMEENPQELMTYEDGSHRPAILASEVHCDEVPGMYTLSSKKWREDGEKALMEFCDEVDTLPIADRVIGYFLAAGGTSEWYPVNSLTEYEDGHYADFSPSFLAAYSDFLRRKYITVEELRRAWKDEKATFENPPIPDMEKRNFIRIDEKIVDALLNYESADRTIGKKIELDPKLSTNLGVFLNANEYQWVADFYDAWHEGTASTIIYFAKALRQRYEGKLIGAFYGSYGCTDFFGGGTATAVLHILDSDVLDFLAAPGVYNNREPGGFVAQREMQDSFRLRNQIYLVEEDSRTHLENAFYRDAMGLYNIRDSICTLKRDFARNICEDIYAWWFDQHEQGGRYQHEEIYELFARQQQIGEYAYTKNRIKNNEIALIYDQESVHYVSQYTNDLMLEYYRTSDLGRIGAPVDYYFHDDMARDDMPDYKLYLMINTFCLDDVQRAAIKSKARKNGAMLVWLYAPGFINPDSDLRMDNKNIEELIDMKIGRVDRTVSPRFKLTEKSHPALMLGDRDRRYGYIDRDVHGNVCLGNVLAPAYMNPGFYIDDTDAEVLGYYCEWEKPAFAIKQQDGYVSAYCAPQILRSELIASLAQYAGCHIYSKDDDCIYANESFVTVHASYTGKHTLYFKKPCNPFEVYEKRYYGNNVTELTIDMRLGDTLMFSLDGEC